MAKKSFPLRVDEQLFNQLKAWAEDEFRSVNGQIEFVLTDALRREGRWKNPAEKPLTSPGDSGETD